MNFFIEFKNRIELKLITIIFVISALIVTLFSTAQFLFNNASMSKIYRDEHIRITTALANHANSMLENSVNDPIDRVLLLQKINNEKMESFI